MKRSEYVLGIGTLVVIAVLALLLVFTPLGVFLGVRRPDLFPCTSTGDLPDGVLVRVDESLAFHGSATVAWNASGSIHGKARIPLSDVDTSVWKSADGLLVNVFLGGLPYWGLVLELSQTDGVLSCVGYGLPDSDPPHEGLRGTVVLSADPWEGPEEILCRFDLHTRDREACTCVEGFIVLSVP